MPDVNDTAPDFTPPRDGGGTVTLSGQRGGPVVLFFYPKDDTPGCTKESIGFSADISAFDAAGAKVFGISKDTVAKHDKFVAKHDLTVPLLSDADPLVRAAAAGLQRAASPQERAARLLPLLDDPRRSVRIAAVKQAFDLPRGLVTGAQGQAMARAMGEWQRSLATRLDFPETHLVLGGMALTLRNAQAAQSAFRRVVELDTQRAEAWPMLVQLTQITQGVDAAREVLREALQAVPDDPTLFQMWGELNP